MHLTWEKQTGKHQLGEWLRVGKVVVGSVSWVGGSKGDTLHYGVNCLLPGIKQVDTKYATQDEAKARLEKMVRAWFAWTQEVPAP